MFSARWFTVDAISAIASIASGVKRTVTPSVRSSSTYGLVKAFRGSLRMRTKSCLVKGSSSTRIGNRPCSSGIRSAGLATWKAPAAMNRMWSVRTIPYLVVTVEPSTIGRRSRCTPSRETSGPRPPSRPATLSSSSRKTIPAPHTGAPLRAPRRAQEPSALRDLHPPPPGAAGHEIREHVLEVDPDLLHPLAGQPLEHGPLGLHVHLDRAIVELA